MGWSVRLWKLSQNGTGVCNKRGPIFSFWLKSKLLSGGQDILYKIASIWQKKVNFKFQINKREVQISPPKFYLEVGNTLFFIRIKFMSIILNEASSSFLPKKESNEMYILSHFFDLAVNPYESLTKNGGGLF